MKRQVRTILVSAIGMLSFCISCNEEKEIAVEKPLQDRLANDAAFVNFVTLSNEVLDEYSTKVNALDKSKSAELKALLKGESNEANSKRAIEILGFQNTEREELNKNNNQLYTLSQTLHKRYPELAEMSGVQKQELFQEVVNIPAVNQQIVARMAVPADADGRVNARCAECTSRYNVCAAGVGASFAAAMVGCLLLPPPLDIICAIAVGIDRNSAMAQCRYALEDCRAGCTP